jgi:hypothetical protein
MGQAEHDTEEPAGTGAAAEAPQGPVSGKIRVTVRRLDRLEATTDWGRGIVAGKLVS